MRRPLVRWLGWLAVAASVPLGFILTGPWFSGMSWSAERVVKLMRAAKPPAAVVFSGLAEPGERTEGTFARGGSLVQRWRGTKRIEVSLDGDYPSGIWRIDEEARVLVIGNRNKVCSEDLRDGNALADSICPRYALKTDFDEDVAGHPCHVLEGNGAGLRIHVDAVTGLVRRYEWHHEDSLFGTKSDEVAELIRTAPDAAPESLAISTYAALFDRVDILGWWLNGAAEGLPPALAREVSPQVITHDLEPDSIERLRDIVFTATGMTVDLTKVPAGRLGLGPLRPAQRASAAALLRLCALLHAWRVVPRADGLAFEPW